MSAESSVYRWVFLQKVMWFSRFSPEEIEMVEKSLWGVTLGGLADLLKDIHNSHIRVQTQVQCRNNPYIAHRLLGPCSLVSD